MSEPYPGMCTIGSYGPVECQTEVMQSEIFTLVFANSFCALDHLKVDCRAEELAQGLHLVILMKDTLSLSLFSL